MKIIYSFVLLGFLSSLLFGCYYFSRNRQADFGDMGMYKFIITDTTLFDQTYLSDDSYGFLITKSAIQGLKIEGFDFVQNKTDLIISKNYPIKAVYTNSKKVNNESENLYSGKKSVEILQDTSFYIPNIVFIYYLKPNNKYRLLLP